MDLALFFFYFVFVVFLLRKNQFFRLPFLKGWSFEIVLIVKVAIAVFFVYYPTSYLFDSPIFLDESKLLSRVFYDSPVDFFKLLTGIGENEELVYRYLIETIHWTQQPDNLFNDSKNLIRFNAILDILSFGNIFVNFLFISLITLVGLKAIYDTIIDLTNHENWFLFALIFLLPSTILWTSAIMKEPYLILGIGFFLKGVWGHTSKANRIWLLAVAVFFLIAFKPYVLVCLLLAVIVYFIYLKVPTKKFLWSASVVIVLSALTFGSTFLLSRNFTEIISKKQFNFINLTEGGIWILTDSCMIVVPKSEEYKFDFFIENKNRYGFLNEATEGEIRRDGVPHQKVNLYPDTTKLYIFHFVDPSGSLIQITPINKSHAQLLKNIPEAVFNTFVRPLPNDPPAKIEKWYFVIENWVLIGLLVWGVSKRKTLSVKFQSLLCALSVFMLFLALMIGWVTPVLGAIIRYKMPIIFALIMIIWILLFSHQTKTKNA